jgi:hypothetical protein
VFDYNIRRWAGPFNPAPHGPTVELEQHGGLSLHQSAAASAAARSIVEGLLSNTNTPACQRSFAGYDDRVLRDPLASTSNRKLEARRPGSYGAAAAVLIEQISIAVVAVSGRDRRPGPK